MTDLREKLVELLRGVQYLGGLEEKIADHLIANGVTIQRWIPVEERLQDHFGVFVVAISEPGKMRVGKDCADFDPFAKTWLPSMCWDRGYKVTHWMPLPQPPKEDEDD